MTATPVPAVASPARPGPPSAANPRRAPPPRGHLGVWLRSLWNIAPALHEVPVVDASTRAFLSPLGMHLPSHRPDAALGAVEHLDWHRAAAAHAAAHLVYSSQRHDGAGLAPISRALLGMLEDARIEWLASRELPGLRALWAAQHTVQPAAQPGFEDLLQRLARCLVDPAHVDAHPWVVKGVRLFYLDSDAQLLALRQPAELRRAATLLGNDIGQMRLPFNARAYCVQPSYRDDNRWLWRPRAEPAGAVATPDAGAPAAPQAFAPHADSAAAPARRLRHAEWDHLIGRYRRDWCEVHDTRPHASASADAPPALPAFAPTERRQLARAVVDALACRAQWRRHQPDGAALDLDAVVTAEVARRRGETADLRWHARRDSGRTSQSFLLLLDASASTARSVHGAGPSVLELARAAAWRCAAAMADAGARCAIHGFCSNGREAVHYQRLKDFDDALEGRATSALAALRSGFSTRLGAALRHATRLALEQGGGATRLLLVTDGEPYDVDVHDAHYLVEDARRAVQEARRQAVRPACLCIGADASAMAPLRHIFGAGEVRRLANLAALPRALRDVTLA